MRLSVDRESPLYDEAKVSARPQVLVDGVKIKRCFEASEDEGWADVWKADSTGKVLLNDAGDAPQRERLHGQVEIRFL